MGRQVQGYLPAQLGKRLQARHCLGNRRLPHTLLVFKVVLEQVSLDASGVFNIAYGHRVVATP